MPKLPHDPKGKKGLLKPQLHLLPPVALIEMAKALQDGAVKYGPFNWRGKSRLRRTTYLAAIFRHYLALHNGEDLASDSKVHHLGHIMANCAIMLDAEKAGTLHDDMIGYPKQRKRK